MDKSVLPDHVAIIMDGNGRWAKKRGLPRSFGHKAGTENVRRIVRYCSNNGIKVLTVYAFSTENFKRPADEVSILMQLLVEYVYKETAELKANNVRIRTIGTTEQFAPKVREAIQYGIDQTKDCTGMIFNIAVAYGGRDEILRAVNKMIADGVTEIDGKTMDAYLDTAPLPDPDLIIRTSGEERLSNFLLWQSAYAELYFTDTLWPDFDEVELQKAFDAYACRSRRYGGV